MDEFKEDKKWFWFIPMLRILLVSGCRTRTCEYENQRFRIEEKPRKSREFYGKNVKEELST